MDTAGGTRYNFDYDKDGNRTHEYFATNDTNSSWALHTQTSYDKSDRPKRITSTRNSATPAKVFDMTYCYAEYVSGQACSTAVADDTGIRQYQKDEISGAVSEYTFDDGNRLTKATNVNGKTYEYDYDTRGNRKTAKVDGTTTQTLAYNSANQITTTGNTYETRGNQTRTSQPEIATLSYNAADQMTSATGPGGQGSYTYAGSDQVELTQAGSIKLDYGRDDQHGMAWLQSWTNGVNPTVYIERDGIGTPLGIRIGLTDYAYVLDGLGSVVAIVGSTNTVAASYKYDPYGVVQPDSNENGLGQPNIIRYAGGTYDTNTRLTKYGQRWYNPNQSRFTQQDSLGFIGNPQHGNRYAYAGDNPISYVDPSGQMPEGEKNIWGGVGMIGGAILGVAFAPLALTGFALGLAIAGGAMVGLAGGAFVWGGINDCRTDGDCF